MGNATWGAGHHTGGVDDHRRRPVAVGGVQTGRGFAEGQDLRVGRPYGTAGSAAPARSSNPGRSRMSWKTVVPGPARRSAAVSPPA